MKPIKDLRQRHLEAFEELFNAQEVKGASRYAGLVVRSAIKAGWFGPEAKADEVDDLTGAAVRKLAKEIDDLYFEAIKLDPNS